VDSVYCLPEAPAGWTLQELLPGAAIRQYSLARWALVDALKLADASQKKVLVPGFICREVLASLAEAGSEAVFYTVDEGLSLSEDPDRLPEAAAVIAADYFGFPQDLAPFEAYCRRTGAVLIEDNAHGALSRTPDGKALGGRAPLAVFSQRKTALLAQGGALAVNDAARFPDPPEQLPFSGNQPGLSSFSGRRLLRAAAPALGARNFLRVIALGRAVRRLRTGSEFPPPRPEGERRIPIPPEPDAGLSAPIPQDPEAEVLRRRELYALSERLLAETEVRPVFKSLPAGVSPYVYPFRPGKGGVEAAERALNAAGLFSLSWPDLPDAVADEAPEHYRDVRGAQFLW